MKNNFKRFCKKLFIASILVLTTTSCCIAYEGEEVEAYNNGIDLTNNDRYEEAIKAFEYAIRIEPSFIDAYYNLGIVQEFTGNKQQALNSYKTILKYNKDDYEAICKIIGIYQDIGNIEKAKFYANQLPKEDPYYAEIARSIEEPPKKEMVDINDNSKDNEEDRLKNIDLSKFGLCEPLKEKFLGFERPAGMVKDSKGNLYVADYNKNSISIITPNGEKRIIAEKGCIKGPAGLAIDNNDNIYVANYKSSNIVILSASGESPQILPIQVRKPYFLMIDDEGTLYISEQGNKSVTKHKLIWMD